MMKTTVLKIVVTFLMVFVVSCSAKKPEPIQGQVEAEQKQEASAVKEKQADLVLTNGKIATVDENFSFKEAVAVVDNKIIFVGTSDQVKQYIGDKTKVIDLEGKLTLPGLIDAHAHMSSLGLELSYLNIHGAKSLQEIVEKVKQRVKEVKKGEWITGGRWNQADWKVKKFPVHDTLSAVSPDNPVYLRRIAGNSAFANKKAMEIAGITKKTPDPKGGTIIRKKNGEPTGVLINQAMNLVLKHIPKDTDEQRRAKFKKATDACLQLGLTNIQEAGSNLEEIQMYKDLVDEGKLNIRMYVMLGDQEKPIFEADDLVAFFKEQKIEERGDYFLSVKSIKLYFDGALGSRGAAFFEPYLDDSKNKGLFRIPVKYIEKVTKAALQAGMGVNTHAIGIRGNAACLDAYEAALKAYPTKDHRLRIEHAQVVRKEEVERFVSLGVIPAMQPTHATSDMVFAERRIGKERSKGAYAWRWFLDAGLIMPAGSDFPVESHNPLFGIYAAVTRKDVNGKPEGGWFPEHRMTMEEAIRGFTIWAAYGAFQEDVLGSIEVGKLADFTVLEKDILTIPHEELLTTKVAYTIIGGKIRFSRE